ncbi:pheromone A receptor-domain-containing protein [Russula aff. rugulosa BPL654]|nr:pheromone A receptor-domain-containing protein [Russula aff. rugulosa BPL654]
MHLPPNELYSTFSFIGFVLSAIPFYWHFKARNTGTCLFMIWTGLGCLMQCINSIVWNKNMINRAPVYCDISTRIQVALNVAIPACSLCINRQLYRVARMKSMGTTDAENRRIVLIDLLIGVGIPILQMIAQYVISTNRYVIFEDFGPSFSNATVLPTLFLFGMWPLVIGVVCIFYCIINIYTFYKRGSQCRKAMSSTSGFSQSRYLRLMVISSVELFATIPLGTFFMVSDAKAGIEPWKSWADTHSHYSNLEEFPIVGMSYEIYRWSLVACAFIFFALFGFAVEAANNIIAYTSYSPNISARRRPLPLPYVKRNGGVTVPIRVMVQTGRDKDNSSVSLTSPTTLGPVRFCGKHS